MAAGVLFGIVLAEMFSASIELHGAADSTNQPAPPFPRGYQQITSLSAATSLTIPANSHAALIQAEDQNLRLSDDPDGTAPTATTGLVIAAGDTLMYDGDLRKVQLIQETATAKANILYYGY
jgi:hypothetical protein